MISYLLRRVGLGLAAASIAATSAAVIVVALAFALFALVRPALGPAGAAAVVAGAAAVLLVLAALSLAMVGRGKPPRIVPHGKDPAARLMNFIREKPVTAIAGALGVGFMAIRNPRYLGAAVRSFLEGRPSPKR